MADPAVEDWVFVPSYPITESWEWSTEVLRCKTWTQRIARRELPRTIIKHQYVMTREDAYRASLLAANQQKIFLPLWQDGFRGKSHDFVILPDHRLYQGDITTWTQSFAGRRFADGRRVIFQDDDQYYEIKTVRTMSFIESFAWLETIEPIGRDFTNAIVAPMIEASVDFEILKQSGDYVTAKAQFVSTEVLPMTMGTADTWYGELFDTYRDHTLVTMRSAAPSKDRHWTEFDVIDNIVGKFEKYKKYDYPMSKAEIDWYVLLFQDLARIKIWLQDTRGRQKAFWMPSFNSDLLPTQPLGSSILTVKYCGYAKYQKTGFIVLIGQDGVFYPREVIASNQISDTEEELQLDEALPSVPVDVISVLRWMRLDTDKVEFNFSGPGIGHDITDPLLAAATIRAPIIEEVPEIELSGA